ncbi:ATP-binding protein [Actinoplanes sp. NPDC051859]|uniref:ATP-binding protein n=1 Tax=Actinoplanes sp. NPDC051859 TaxID=3363909 RepID=UPI00378C8F38
MTAPAVLFAMRFTAHELDDVRVRVREHSAVRGLDGDDLTDWVMAVNELANNAVRHGSPTAELTLVVAADRLRCQVRDQGRGFDVTRFLGRPTRPTLTASGGLGLWLVEHTAQILSITSGADGTTVAVTPRVVQPPG